MSGPLTRFGFAEETPEQRQEKILAGVMASVYRQVPQSVLVSIVGAFALVMVLWNSIEQDLLLGWSLLILFESLLRLRLRNHQLSRFSQSSNRPHVTSRFRVGTIRNVVI